MGFVPNELHKGILNGQMVVQIKTVLTLEPPSIVFTPLDFWYMDITTAAKYGCYC